MIPKSYSKKSYSIIEPYVQYNLSNVEPKETTCPNTPSTCGYIYHYQCLEGDLKDKCDKTPDLFLATNYCTSYCDILKSTVKQTPIIPPAQFDIQQNVPIFKSIAGSKQQTCPEGFKSICDRNVPYQCTSGKNTDNCSNNINTWNNSNLCDSFCNIYDNNDKPIPLKKERKIKIINNSIDKGIWIGILENNLLSKINGFSLSTQSSSVITVPSNWNGVIWGRTDCTWQGINKVSCKSGNCNDKINCENYPMGAVSYVKIILSDIENIPDSYSVNLTDGFNLPVTIKPIIGSYEKINDQNNSNLNNLNCGTAGCYEVNLNECPLENRTLYGCASTCTTLKYPQDNAYNISKNITKQDACCNCSTETCINSSQSSIKCPNNKTPYMNFFSKQCPDAINSQYNKNKIYKCLYADYEINFY